MNRPALRRYCHAIFDSARWDGFTPRPGDIVISTSMKAGTTWTQGIIANMLWPDGNLPAPRGALSPWLDARFSTIEEVLALLEGQTHRRFIKTHTTADGIPLFDEVKYIVVGRDGRDVFMSMMNHWKTMRREVVDFLNAASAHEATPFPYFDEDIHGAFATFISRGSFPWEGDGAPWWSHFSHAARWWELRDEPNVLFVHYSDLLSDLSGEMRRIGSFTGIEVPEEKWAAVVERCTIKEMRETARKTEELDRVFEGGADSFFYKGTNGRWREVFSEDELVRYAKRVNEVLPPDAVAWLENGRNAVASLR